MIEIGRAPGAFGVTHGTIGREITAGVIGIGDIIVIRLMAAYTFTGQIELITDMAIVAINHRMCANKLKTTGLDMVKYRPLPPNFSMASLAFGGKTQIHMSRI